MRAALIVLALAAVAAPARAAPRAVAPVPAVVPLALAERQLVTLEFDRPVARVAVTDPELLSLRTRGSRVDVGALRGGRGSLEVAFDDGASVVYDVTVAAVRRPSAIAGAPSTIALAVGEERRLRAPGVVRVLVEENGVARVRVEGEAVVVLAVVAGTTSVVLVDGSGARTTWAVTVR